MVDEFETDKGFGTVAKDINGCRALKRRQVREAAAEGKDSIESAVEDNAIRAGFAASKAQAIELSLLRSRTGACLRIVGLPQSLVCVLEGLAVKKRILVKDTTEKPLDKVVGESTRREGKAINVRKP